MKKRHDLRRWLKNALDEDTGGIDITTEAIFERDFTITAELVARQRCILAGITVFREAFLVVDRRIEFSNCLSDGADVKADSVVCILKGKLKSILRTERVALNIISHLSGIATYTNEFVRQTGDRFRILDTRKTLPGLRNLEKYAVRVGGGYNHRMSLSEMVLIKDNHINLWSKYNNMSRTDAIRVLVSRAKRKIKIPVEVEVESCKEAIIATQAGADILMFDNTDISEIKKF